MVGRRVGVWKTRMDVCVDRRGNDREGVRTIQIVVVINRVAVC